MAFLDTTFWTKEMPIYPMLKQLADNGKYRNLLLSISDDPDEIVATMLRFRQ